MAAILTTEKGHGFVYAISLGKHDKVNIGLFI